MIPIKINGEKRLCPASWEDVTFNQYLKLIEAGEDRYLILSIILDYPVDQISKAKIEGLEFILHSLAFLKTTPALYKEPKKLGSYEFPKAIEFETVEQFEDVRSEIARVSSLGLYEQNKALAFYAAVYLCKPYDYDRAKTLSESFLTMPCLEVMSAGSFFSAKCLSIQTGLGMNYLRRNIRFKKRRLALSSLISSLGFTRRWTRLLATFTAMMNSFSNGRSQGSTPS